MPHSLRGKKILITLGATREYWDPVRFLTNASSGKMGLAIADQCRKLGAKIYILAGPNVNIGNRSGEQIISARDLLEAARKKFFWSDVFIACAAVSDFRFSKVSQKKIKRGAKSLKIQMIPNPDILAALAKKKKHQICVGFALEDHNALDNAKKKMERKNCDMIVLNSPTTMESNTIDATLLFKNGTVQSLGTVSKTFCAEKICAAITQCLTQI